MLTHFSLEEISLVSDGDGRARFESGGRATKSEVPCENCKGTGRISFWAWLKRKIR